MTQASRHRVVIVGGGFGGVYAARALKNADVSVTLVDRRNFHLFQPLLYQVATGALSPANIAEPLRSMFEKQRNCEVILDEAVGLDAKRKVLQLRGGELPYDTLVIATGSKGTYFGHDQWSAYAPGLKTVEDATEMRRRIFTAFEAAERTDAPDRRQALLTFVIVGGGPTGVELAGALAEISRQTLKNEFRRMTPSDAKIILVETQGHVLPGYPLKLQLAAERDLQRLGVTVMNGTLVSDVREDSVSVRQGDRLEVIPCRTVLWAAGVQASSFAKVIAEATGATLDRGGRVIVGDDLSLPTAPEVFVIGDAAHCAAKGHGPLPGVAQVAIQEGKYVARRILDRLKGVQTPPFQYRDMGMLATIGKKRAVAHLGRFQFRGVFAWIVWLVVHLFNIIPFEQRVLVLMQWAFNYITNKRSARLITQTPAAVAKGKELSVHMTPTDTDEPVTP